MQKQENRILADLKSVAYSLSDVMTFMKWSKTTVRKRVTDKDFPQPMNYKIQSDPVDWAWNPEHIMTWLQTRGHNNFRQFQINQSDKRNKSSVVSLDERLALPK